MHARLPRPRAKKLAGFTILEVLFVVTIFGILTTATVPAFIKFLRKAKTSEAGLSLAAVGDGPVAWFDREHADISVGTPMSMTSNSAGISYDAVPRTVTTSGNDEIREMALLDRVGKGLFAEVEAETIVGTDLQSSADETVEFNFEFLNPDTLLPNPTIQLGEPGARISLDLSMNEGALLDWGFTAEADELGDLMITDRRGSFLDSDLTIVGNSITSINNLTVPIDLTANVPIQPTYEIRLSASEGTNLPEPSTFMLALLGLMWLNLLRRRRRRRTA